MHLRGRDLLGPNPSLSTHRRVRGPASLYRFPRHGAHLASGGTRPKTVRHPACSGPVACLVNGARSANDSASAHSPHPTRARCAGNISSITLMIRSAKVIAS